MQSTRQDIQVAPGALLDEPSRFDRFAALVALTAFGLTWPVLQLLGENAEFFLARRSPKLEIVVLAVFATVLFPALVGMLGSLPGRWGAWIAFGLVVVTASSMARLFLTRLGLPVIVTVVLALAAAVAIAWVFYRYAAVRQVARYLLPAPLVLLAVFLVSMPVGEVLREPDSAVGNPMPVGNPAPVVLLVFDEFPVASIIDSAGSLRADRYPNFARLADDGVWYPNAVTVQQQTEHSVPAILTGRVPDQSLTPVTGQYPFNLFTALRTSHDLHVHEAITQLCPRQLCEGATSSATSLVRDVGVVAGHVLLPEPVTRGLPPIDQGWGDFQAVATDFDARSEFLELLDAGARQPIDDMLARIVDASDGDRPPLYYLHMLIPHHPWQYLPDGRSYPYVVGANPASLAGGWIEDDFLVAQGMQRHLLQVGYADFVLGEVLAALESEGVYDESLVVVVADHGISVKPGVPHQRTITESTVGEVAAIPLFVKYPDGPSGVVDDRRALTTDILPTIAEVLEADLPGDVEGLSLLGPAPDRDETTTIGPDGAVTYDAEGDEKLETAERIESWFPSGDPWALRPRGSPDLVGESVDVSLLPDSAVDGQLLEPELYATVDTTGPVIPARVGATLSGEADGDEVIAVVVNGTVAAVTRSYVFEGETSVLAMVEPSFYVDGANQVDFLEVTPEGELHLIAP